MAIWSVWLAVWLLTYFPHLGQMLQHSRFHLLTHTKSVRKPNVWTGNMDLQVMYSLHTLSRAGDIWTINHCCFTRRCLAFISRKCTGVWTAAASAAPSRPALGSRTASGMRKTSGAVSGKTLGNTWAQCEGKVSYQHIHAWYVCLFSVTVSEGWAKAGLETSAMPVCCWWNDGKSSQWEPRRTGIM